MSSVARPRFFLPAILIAVVLMLSACSGQTTEQQPSQVVARVNKVEITLLQFNNALRTMGVAVPSESVQREATSKLIDREIAVQAATKAGMDKYPEVLLRIEEARRDVLARAFVERTAARAKPPTAEEAERFYKVNPALFSERRIYRLREAAFSIELEQLDEIKDLLSETSSLNEVSHWSRAQTIPFNEQIVIRSAEQLPMETLPRFQQAKTGDTLIFESPQGLLVYEVLDAQPAPITLEAARPVVLDHLTRQVGISEVESRIRTLRSMAVISYSAGFSPQGAADLQIADSTVQPR